MENQMVDSNQIVDTDIKIIMPDEVISPDAKLDKNGNPIIRDKQGRFPAGVTGNPKGRKKGGSFAEVIQKVFDEGSAEGISYEMFVQKMIIKAYRDNDPVATRFIVEKTPKPRSQIEIGNVQSFELYDLSKESKEEEEDSEGDEYGDET